MVMMRRNLDLYDITFSDELYEIGTVHIKDIIIPEDFRRTKCGYNKIRRAKEYYERNGHFDKPISVVLFVNERKSNDLLLVDEYSRYLAAKKLGLSEVEVQYIFE